MHVLRAGTCFSFALCFPRSSQLPLGSDHSKHPREDVSQLSSVYLVVLGHGRASFLGLGGWREGQAVGLVRKRRDER